MKIKHLPFALAAITLFSCGGGTNQNQNTGAANDTATVETPQCDVSTTPPQKDILTEYAVSILKDHLEVGDVVADKITNECEPFNNHPYAGDNFRFFEHEDGNFSMYWYLYFYPKKSGGYEVIVEITGAGGDAYEPIYNYEKFICQDDKITKAENIVDMKITDFYSNSDKFPKAAVEAIETAIKEHPDIGIGDNKITASFNPWYWEEYDNDFVQVLPKPLEGFEDKEGDVFPSISYIWNGEKFIRDPECKPYEEDLSLFDIESDEVREKKFLANLPKHYTDSVYEFSTESIDEDADFHSGNFDYYFPYKNKEGEYFVLSVFQVSSAGANSCDFSSFNYKDGEKKKIEDFLPVPKLSELINPDQREKHPELYNELEQECKDGIQYYSSNYDSYTKSLTLFLFFDDQELWDKYDELSNGSLESHYKWNGEKFVKFNE